MAITFVDAWRKDDPQLEAEARAFWTSHKVLPGDADVDKRVKQLAVLAYDENVLIGISTIEVKFFDLLQENFGFIREVVASDRRLEHISIALTQRTREVVEAYALAHLNESIAGIAAVLQAPGIGKRAISRGGGLVLMGYTDRNEQVRACWFDHFRVKSRLPDAS
ncbi:MAG: hypothetical protein Q7S99_05425 [Parvibaculum sp.]|nr:hypothetical protein [Parvibaculum sp.]|tara:strand:+ start:7159 stop:7653 length:495 start_codon:yes stop_codon:yes gene_type:complete